MYRYTLEVLKGQVYYYTIFIDPSGRTLEEKVHLTDR